MTDANAVQQCLLGLDWPCLTQSEWAAWVQAIGSILALIVAVGIASWQASQTRRNATEDRKRQASIAATRLSIALHGAQSEAQMKLRSVRTGIKGLNSLTVPLSSTEGWFKICQYLRLRSADRLEDAHTWAMLFDERLGQQAIMVASAPSDYNHFLDSALADYWGTWTAEIVMDLHEELDSRLQKLIDNLTIVQSGLQQVHGIIPPASPIGSGEREIVVQR